MHCRRCETGPPPSGQRGAALVVALLVFGLSAALLVAMKSEFTLFYQRGSNLFLAEQGQAYLRGAEDLAALALIMDFDADQAREQPRDDLGEFWAQQATPYPLDEGGWLTGSLQDLQGRFNLNALADQGAGGGGASEAQAFTASQAQFIRLLQALEEPAVSLQEAIQVTQSIGDWLDVDTAPRLYGAEDDYYFGLSPAYRAANRPMASVSELRAVANISPELYRALQPLVTVWPQTPAGLNIHTAAAAALLRSLNSDDELAPLSETQAQALLERQRSEGGFEGIDELLADPMFADKPTVGLRSLLTEQSSWFLLTAEVEVAERNMRLYSVLQRDQRRVRAVARASGSL